MPGTVLLLAASPMGKGCLVDAASVLPVLAAVAPAVLSGTDTANVVELADPLEPQAVLTRLRAAAAAPGPLTVFLTGSSSSTAASGFPISRWPARRRRRCATRRSPGTGSREELRLRAPGSTTLFARSARRRGDLAVPGGAARCDAGPAARVYGRIAPPPPRRAVAAPTYMKAVATILRSGGRPAIERLHQAALARIAGDGEVGDLVLTPWSTPTTSPRACRHPWTPDILCPADSGRPCRVRRTWRLTCTSGAGGPDGSRHPLAASGAPVASRAPLASVAPVAPGVAAAQGDPGASLASLASLAPVASRSAGGFRRSWRLACTSGAGRAFAPPTPGVPAAFAEPGASRAPPRVARTRRFRSTCRVRRLRGLGCTPRLGRCPTLPACPPPRENLSLRPYPRLAAYPPPPRPHLSPRPPPCHF